jgi:septal ring factor EnvC (AmiA/AmiB activator)
VKRILRLGIPLLCAAMLLPGAAWTADSASLERALSHLQAARNELERSGKEKGKVKDALAATNEAIDQVRKAIQKSGKKK